MLQNAIKYAADAVDEELDAMIQTPVDPAEWEVLQKELKLMAKLLDKLTYLETRCRSYLQPRSRRPDEMNPSTGGAGQTSPSNPPGPSA